MKTFASGLQICGLLLGSVTLASWNVVVGGLALAVSFVLVGVALERR